MHSFSIEGPPQKPHKQPTTQLAETRKLVIVPQIHLVDPCSSRTRLQGGSLRGKRGRRRRRRNRGRITAACSTVDNCHHSVRSVLQAWSTSHLSSQSGQSNLQGWSTSHLDSQSERSNVQAWSTSHLASQSERSNLQAVLSLLLLP